MDTVFVKDETKTSQHVIVTDNANVSKVREMIESEGRYTICDTAKPVGISLSWMLFILNFEKKIGNTNDFCPIDIDILTDDPKRVHVQIATWQLLKMFLRSIQRQFAKIDTGDKTCLHYFESIRKIGNKIWLA